MGPADDLVGRILGGARLPRRSRRDEVARELAAHLEDFACEARAQGLSEAEIDVRVRARFGDPQEIADGFAEVYRWERTVLHAAAFLGSSLAAAAAISAVVCAVQASMILGLGMAAPGAFTGHHLVLEAGYLFTTAAAYVGLVALERLFAGQRFLKALAATALAVAASSSLLAISVGHAEVLLLGAASGAVVRALHRSLPSAALRLIAVTGLFAALGWLAACLQASGGGASLAPRLAVWVAIGLSCHAMTSLSARLDRAFLGAMQAA